jgi:predicted O-methyltransferase YrrM
MDLLNPEIETYLCRLSEPSTGVLGEMEAYGRERGFPLVGPLVGQLLGWLVRSVGARTVFELGSGFGYSAFWFAAAVGPGGRVFLTERSEANLERARDFLGRAGLEDRVVIIADDALAALDRHDGPFDIIFNDIDKESYPEVIDRAAARLRPGGLFVSDNMLWFGKVLESDPDAATRGVLELTRRLYGDPRFDTILIPIRDGVTVSRKRTGSEPA